MCMWIPLICIGQVDSLYIGRYPHKVMLMGYVGKDFLSLDIDTPDKDLLFMPNNPVELGLGISWKNTILSVSGGYGFDFMRDKKKGKTKSFDFQIHSYGSQFTWDLFIQRYKGFYEDNSSSNHYPIYPDLRIYQYGGSGQYVLNHKKFSYKAAFTQSEKQLRSAGSVLFGAGIYITHIDSDTAFVFKDKNSLDNFQFGVSAGYTYTFVLGRRWYINATTTVGLHFGSEKISTFGKQRLEVYPSVFPRVAIGYNKENWGMRFVYVNSITFPAYGDKETLGIMSGSFQLAYTHRVADIPFLSKLLFFL